MKKNKTEWILTLVFITMLTSCVGAEILTKTDDDQKITFTTGEITRLNKDIWEQGDQIGIVMYDYPAMNTVYYNNYRYDAASTGGNSFSPKDGDMVFLGDNKYVFNGYYPYDPNMTWVPYSAGMGTYSINLTANPKQDFMIAQTVQSGKEDGKIVKLNFIHRMAKITLKLTSGTGSPDLTDNGISIINGYAKATFNFRNEMFTTTGGTINTFPAVSSGVANEYYFIMLPQTMTSGSYLWVNVNSGDIKIDLSNKVLEAKEYIYNFTINNGTVTLTDSSILGRETGSSTTSTVTI